LIATISTSKTGFARLGAPLEALPEAPLEALPEEPLEALPEVLLDEPSDMEPIIP
jgi:hypothetical protein